MPQTEEVEIYVEDTGIGIPQSEQKMIFGRFYKQNEFAQGTGLGTLYLQTDHRKTSGKAIITVRSRHGKPLLHFLFLQKATYIKLYPPVSTKI